MLKEWQTRLTYMGKTVMTRRGLISRLLTGGLVLAIALLAFFATPAQAQPLGAGAGAGQELTVYRSPTCHCCGHWVDHIEAAGFRVKSVVTSDMAAIKIRYGVPEELTSCHTAIVGGYVIEGHVPAADVQRLLSEQPQVLGLAVPGMPMGSPGMESGARVDPYKVVSFTRTGETATFAEHP